MIYPPFYVQKPTQASGDGLLRDCRKLILCVKPKRRQTSQTSFIYRSRTRLVSEEPERPDFTLKYVVQTLSRRVGKCPKQGDQSAPWDTPTC